MSKEVEVLKLVIKILPEIMKPVKVKATETLECDKWKIKYDDMKEQNDLLQETLRNCFAQNQESNDTVSQLMQQHVEQLNTVKSELNAERKNNKFGTNEFEITIRNRSQRVIHETGRGY